MCFQRPEILKSNQQLNNKCVQVSNVLNRCHAGRTVVMERLTISSGSNSFLEEVDHSLPLISLT